MAEPTKNLMEHYDDIDLCYKVMGLTFSDPPDRVDKVYKSLIDEYTRMLSSADLVARKEAQANIDQAKDLYERITGSMIYKDYAREYEKYKQLKDEQMAARNQKNEAEKNLMVCCPYCNKMIMPNLKVCMYCKGKILTPLELLIKKIFSTRNLVIMAVVVVVVVAGVILLLNPQLLKK